MKWAVLVPADDRPEILNERHSDYIWPLSYLPRSLNAWIPEPWEAPPIKLFGSADEDAHHDIPQGGTWVVTQPIFGAFTTRRKFHGRLGMRYDYIDDYYVVPSFRFDYLASAPWWWWYVRVAALCAVAACVVRWLT